jgi:hypothetical protein
MNICEVVSEKYLKLDNQAEIIEFHHNKLLILKQITIVV